MGKGVVGLRLVEDDLGQGLLVNGIVADPAKDAGFQISDLVLQVNNLPIKHMADVPIMLGSVEPGQQLKFHIRRFGSEMDLVLIVGQKPTLIEKLKGENKTDAPAAMAADIKATPGRPVTPPKENRSGSDKDHKKPKQQSLPEGYVNPKIKKTKKPKEKVVNSKLKHHKDVVVEVDRSVDSESKHEGSKSGGGFFSSLMPSSFRQKHGRSHSAHEPAPTPPPSAAPQPTDRPEPPPRRRSLIEKVKENNSAQKKDSKSSNESKKPRTPPRKS